MSVPNPEIIKMQDINRDASGRNGNSLAWQERAAAAILMKYRHRRLVIRMLEALLRPLVWLSKSEPLQDLDTIARILVFDYGNLGDIALLAPFLRSLRIRFPKAHIAVLGKSSVKLLLLDQELADELIPVRVPWAEHLSRWRRYNPFSPLWISLFRDVMRLRERPFDLAFVAGRGDIRTNLVIWLSGSRRRVAYAFAGGGFLLTDAVMPDLQRPHNTDLSLRLLKHIGVPVERSNAPLRISMEDEEFALRFFAEHGVRRDDLLIGIHPGARMPIRQWGEDRFMAVARRLIERFGVKIAWFADPARTDSLPADRNIISVRLPLRQFLAVLSRCRLFVCNDSGPMHMASGLGVPVVAVFGPQQPEWFGPLGSQHRVVIRGDVWCRPCADRCLFEEPYCLTLIPVEQVIQAVTESMERLPQPIASRVSTA